MTPDESLTPSHPPSDATVSRAHVDAARYDEMYAASVSDPEGFWAEQGRRIDWMTPFG
ncbi:acetyl-coenzyme A synthetase N-terminal domain-containing protein, partial [Salibaculum sp.]|uniref:acetyl-coenzyme A synthetase N-terminal domain-containing protein n=1 Tax=Salibaculum sp. TaxID=2855480 RepID=UPI002B4634AD